MADHRLYNDFIARLGDNVSEADNAFINSILNEAEEFTLDYIGRDTVPQRLDSAVVYLAVTAFNMRGAEGETSRSEGGISRAFDAIPVTVRKRFENYPKKVGVIYASDEG